MSSSSSCKKCDKKHTYVYWKWCKPCQINNLKGNFTNWTSGNEKIDNFIQEMQLKIDGPWNIVFEWILYDQFSDIKEIGKGGFATVYSAIWKDGPLKYNEYNKEYTREADKKVALKCLYNSQNITNEFLNEVLYESL
jgi:serine/threonine protein kinase